MIKKVKLVPKTVFGHKMIGYVNKPENWDVKRWEENVSFADGAGPWLLVAPSNERKDKDRWVSLTDDRDFIVEIVV